MYFPPAWDPTTRDPQTVGFTLSADACRILVHIADMNDAPTREVMESLLFRIAAQMDAGELYEIDLGGVPFSVMDGAQRYLAGATEFHERRIRRMLGPAEGEEDGGTPSADDGDSWQG
jgi:hypothetical protein